MTTNSSSPASSPEESLRFYHNPVHDRSFPDPYILKYGGEFWAYCTDFREDGRCFGVMHSRDLVHWTEVCGALAPLPGGATCYWAPEVAYLNGRFYMYYSIGNEERMEIRVAIADHPAGPFEDAGRRLTREDFAIDAHLFEDDDGSFYLFYATDFLEHSFIGTGTVCDRMLDPLTPAGSPHPVARARYDWQVYDPRRESKGGVRWHTVEGPFVLKHKGRYYEMFSGGNWQNITYGVGYAVSDRIISTNEWEQVADGENALPILRTIPGKVIGPGHNSVVRGSDNRQLFCVYHRWSADESRRVLCIDRMEFVGDRLVVLGPSIEPQPMPILPSVRGFTSGSVENGQRWYFTGNYWDVTDRSASQRSSESFAAAGLRIGSSSFLMELHLRALEHVGEGRFGVILNSNGGPLLRVAFSSEEGCVAIAQDGTEEPREEVITLPLGFDPRADHLVRIELDHLKLTLTIDGHARRWSGLLASVPTELTLFTERSGAVFSGPEMTCGYENLFMEECDPGTLGWEAPEHSGWSITGMELRRERYELESIIRKRVPFESYEATVNARLGEAEGGGEYGFLPAIGEATDGPLLRVVRQDGRWGMAIRKEIRNENDEEIIPLPDWFDPSTHQHFRFRKEKGHLILQWEGTVLGEIDVDPGPAHLGLYARGAAVGFDMVRVTALPR